MSENILEEALKVTQGDRRRDYGHPYINHKRIAELWSVVLDMHITPYQAAVCMMLTKVAREMNTPKRDNWVDMAGYARVIQVIREYEERDEHELGKAFNKQYDDDFDRIVPLDKEGLDKISVVSKEERKECCGRHD